MKAILIGAAVSIAALLFLFALLHAQRKVTRKRRCRTIVKSEHDLTIIGDGAVSDWSKQKERPSARIRDMETRRGF